jgi:hypothetical protein
MLEWAAHLHGLYSVDAVLQLASLTGHGLPHSGALSGSAAEGAEDAAATAALDENLERALAPPAEAAPVVNFWRDAGPDLWFTKNSGFRQALP